GPRIRGIDRATGILHTYVNSLGAGSLAVGPNGQLFAASNLGLTIVDLVSGTLSSRIELININDCQTSDGWTQVPPTIAASSGGIVFTGYGCFGGVYDSWVGTVDQDFKLHPLLETSSEFVAAADDGAVLYLDYYGLQRLDPVTGMTSLVGGGEFGQ